ncbi:PREDICTED: uncharacterized protein LOC108609879 [Drosophila arizonae]|uniref:Uncharacterized protein LOC108609879 n=1 Tax=Drosophila arizonae TaxID=7263 RepID=A0ABM1NQA4_DROAR|nr:PREDICTED: uncharacterized protein LOC108609879 [Drosophila arizonae]
MQNNESSKGNVPKEDDMMVTGRSCLKKPDRNLGHYMQRNVSQYRQEGGENQRKLKNLNRQFERDILHLENSITSLEVPEKSLAAEWMSKLKARPPNMNEAIARNYILTYMLRLTHLDMFKVKPFNGPPPQNALSNISSAIPVLSTNTKSISDLYCDSMDNGAFLNKLPVPRDGAFFVMHLLPNLRVVN